MSGLAASSAIRPACAADCATLTAMMLRSHAYQGRYQSMVATYPVTPEMIGDGGTWLIEREGRLAGFYRLDVEKA